MVKKNKINNITKNNLRVVVRKYIREISDNPLAESDVEKNPQPFLIVVAYLKQQPFYVSVKDVGLLC